LKLAFLDPLEPRLLNFPKTYLPDHEVLTTTEQGVLPEGVEAAEAIVWRAYPVDRALIERLPRLRFVQRIGLLRTKGDAAAALAKGIPVSVLPHGVSDRVGQRALALTLAVLHQLRPGHNAMIEGRNSNNFPEEEATGPPLHMNWTGTPWPDTLNDKTVGIIGYGEIGSCLRRLLRPFDCHVLYHKRIRLSPDLERHFDIEYATLEDVMRRSDVVEAVLPYSEETRRLIGAREFGLMKADSIFINVGRGPTVDEPAMIEALQKGTPAYAGLDVFSVEPLPVESPLLRLDNVVLTPHNAGGTPGWVNTFQRIAENLRRIEAGEPPMLPMAPDDPQFP
jgi:phosphoglycerate dehydrogenase-like enzyme